MGYNKWNVVRPPEAVTDCEVPQTGTQNVLIVPVIGSQKFTDGYAALKYFGLYGMLYIIVISRYMPLVCLLVRPSVGLCDP